MSPVSNYDFILAGAGASGLALAYALPATARILLVDTAKKTKNDRTWCFWENHTSPLDAIVYRSWQSVYFHSQDFSSCLSIAPYTYKMIRGIDYYTFMQSQLESRGNITFLYGNIDHLESDHQEARLTVGDTTYSAPWGFNSAFRPTVTLGYHSLLQHFKGYIVQTPHDAFDPSAAVMMDFRIEQHNETQFVYVLPFDTRTALVEYTLFSSQLLPDHEYDHALKNYLQTYLNISQFTILETEFGIIPMTDAPFPAMHSPRIVNTGIAGGRAKASTGYAFKRILRQAELIAHSIIEFDTPILAQPLFDRPAWLDSIYLRVLEQKRMGGAQFFADLFAKNPAALVLKFLDEDTTLLEDVRLMSSVDLAVFTKSALEIIAYKARRSLMRIAPMTTR